MQILEKLESNVRAYCRDFPTVFERARGALMYDREGREYVDFLAGAGALNYGHNDPEMKRRLIAYLEADGVAHSLDMATGAKAEFLEAFARLILAPRGLDHKVMFPGPTGTNAVESALKLARKVTGRATVVAFTGAFHGMTLGSLAATGNAMKRAGAGLPLVNAVSLPYDGYLGPEIDTVGYLARLLDDRGSGLDLPAAVIVETVQGEGGLNAASDGWLCRLERLCRARGILLIVDDIQAGCGRTGTFFSFEPAGIVPDIVCLSKSIGGYGLPMALTLMRPSLDIWRPGEHNGTFRGNNLAFVAGAAALERWRDGAFANDIGLKAAKVRRALGGLARQHRALRAHVRGRGLLQGLACGVPGAAERIAAAAFARGLVIETSGPESEVVKVMPPLTIEDAELSAGLDILAESAAAVARELAADARKVA